MDFMFGMAWRDMFFFNVESMPRASLVIIYIISHNFFVQEESHLE